MTSKELVVEGEDALKVADALTSTSFRILQLLSKKHLDVTTIAEKLGLSEPYMSDQLRTLEELKIITASYEKGRRGVRKLCTLAVNKITIVISPKYT